MQNLAPTFKWKFDGPIHFWSLAVEEHFYFFWPLIVYKLSIQNLKKVSYVLIFLSFVLRFIFYKNQIDVFYFTFTRMDELLIGAMLAIYGFENKISNNTKFNLIGILVLGVVITFIFISNNSSGGIISQLCKFNLVALLYFLFFKFVFSLNECSSIKKILSSSLFRYTGKISYGLYVYHPLVFNLVFYYIKQDDFLSLFILCFVITFFISIIIYNYL